MILRKHLVQTRNILLSDTRTGRQGAVRFFSLSLFDTICHFGIWFVHRPAGRWEGSDAAWNNKKPDGRTFRQRVWSVVSLSAGCLSVSGISSLCCVDVVSACVDGDGDREFSDGQPGDGFRSQIFKCDHLHVGDAFS